jgi:DNA-binding LacI/PurR family transcriptional regulator
MKGDFKDLTAELFKECGWEDPRRSFRRWQTWFAKNRNRSDLTKHKKALEFAFGKGEATVRNYFSRRWKLSKELLDAMDAMTVALGRDIPSGSHGKAPRPPRGGRRIALLTALEDIPSPPFHLEVLRSVIRAASDRNFSTALHEETELRCAETIRKVVRVFRPDAIVLIRVSPNGEALKALDDVNMPAVLVHRSWRRSRSD